MSKQKAKELVHKMATDHDFRSKVQAAGSRDEKKKLMDAHGFGDVNQNHVHEAIPEASAELTDKDLDAVAGGSAAGWVSTTASVTGAVAAAF